MNGVGAHAPVKMKKGYSSLLDSGSQGKPVSYTDPKAPVSLSRSIKKGGSSHNSSY